MNQYLPVLVVLVLTSSSANTAEYGSPIEWSGKSSLTALGAYACIVHRAVGIQGDRKKGERFAGAIKQTDEKTKFTLVLKERTDGLVGSQYCANAKPNRPDKPGKLIETGYRYYSDLDYWFTCKATYELQLSPSKNALTLRGDGRYTFIDQAPFSVFQLFGELGFVYTYDDFVGNFYMEEGQCQKM